MKKKIVLGICGVSRSGKDLFCQLLIDVLSDEGLIGTRYALADELKRDLNELTIPKLDIDLLDCRPEEKELLRPMMVEYGRAHRIRSQGTYWTSLIKESIDDDDVSDVCIVTDIRYDQFKKDEVNWMQKEMGGVLVHIARLDEDNNLIQPPNEDERGEDPKLEAKADHGVVWKTSENMEYLKEHARLVYKHITL